MSYGGMCMLRKVQRLWTRLLPLLSRLWQDILEGRQLVYHKQIKKLCSLVTSNLRPCCQAFPAQQSLRDEPCHGRSVSHMKIGKQHRKDLSALQITGIFRYLFILESLHFAHF